MAKGNKTKNQPARTAGGRIANAWRRMNRYFRDVGSELKKVTWPTRTEFIKYVGVVLLFVAIFALVVGIMDYGLVNLLQLVTG